MKLDNRRRSIVNLHKKWAGGLTLIWLMIVLLLSGGTYHFYDFTRMPNSEQNAGFILLGTVIVIVAICQCLGLFVTRLHLIIEKFDLEYRRES